MVTKQTTLQAFRKSLLVTLALTALLAACAPAQPSQRQVQSLVQTSVASTMQAQNQVGTFVAQTVQAQQPAATETQQPIATDTPTVETTETPLVTLTPILSIPLPRHLHPAAVEAAMFMFHHSHIHAIPILISARLTCAIRLMRPATTLK